MTSITAADHISPFNRIATKRAADVSGDAPIANDTDRNPEQETET